MGFPIHILKRPRFGKGRIRRRPGEMNKLETAYRDHLEMRQAAKEIQLFMFEAVTFKLGHDLRYTPDFMVLMADEQIEFHEVKGHWEDDALVKIKAAAEHLPFRFVGVSRPKGKTPGFSGWEYRHFTAEIA